MNENTNRKEILACIDDINIKYLHSGQTSKYIFPMERKEAHINNISHLIVRFLVVTITPKNEILYLVQKRGKNKMSYPEYFTDSASGHIIYENKLGLEAIKENALRELEEEFGIPTHKVQKIVFHNLEIEKDNFTNEIAYIFYGLVDHDVKLQPNPHELEIDGSRFYSKSELENILEREKLVDYSKQHWIKLLGTNILKLLKEKEYYKDTPETALFIGRFQPFHLGHLHVIQKILKECKKLIIGIGSSQLSHTKNDPFTSDERTQFIVSSLESISGITPERYEIIKIPDIFNAEKWVDQVVSTVGEFDVIFSNSEWVRQLFQNKGIKVAEKVLLELDNYNATKIRNLIVKNDNKWLGLVPKSVQELIKKFNGIDRIRALYNNKK